VRWTTVSTATVLPSGEISAPMTVRILATSMAVREVTVALADGAEASWAMPA
jgi:hypothetical protein